MTTCIAAIAIDHTLVSASDTKLSFGSRFSVEGVIKAEPFHGEWTAMIGGDDVAQAVPVIEKATRILRGKGDDFVTVMDGFTAAYQAHRRKMIEDELLSGFEMSIAEFKKTARQRLDPNVHADLSFQIKNYDLECAFLVFGYDKKRVPHLFEVRNPGKATVHDKPGFWAIGSGASSALNLLAFLGQAREASSMADTIYNVLAAKFYSESASDVGKETFFFVKKYGTYAFGAQGKLRRGMREIWEKDGKPKIPASIEQFVATADINFWYTAKEKRRQERAAQKATQKAARRVSPLSISRTSESKP